MKLIGFFEILNRATHGVAPTLAARHGAAPTLAARYGIAPTLVVLCLASCFLPVSAAVDFNHTLFTADLRIRRA